MNGPMTKMATKSAGSHRLAGQCAEGMSQPVSAVATITVKRERVRPNSISTFARNPGRLHIPDSGEVVTSYVW